MKKVTFFEAISILGSGDMHPDGIRTTERILKFADIKKDDLILDIGCGTGKTACLIAERYGCKVIGIDNSKDMIAKAKHRGKGLKDVKFICCDIHDLDFDDGLFDKIILESVLIYVDKKKALSEMKRVLKKGGDIWDVEFSWKQEPYSDLEKQTSVVLDHDVSILDHIGWRRIFFENGFKELGCVQFSFDVSFRYYFKKLISQGLRMPYILYKSFAMPGILEKILLIKRHFQYNSDYFGYSILGFRR